MKLTSIFFPPVSCQLHSLCAHCHYKVFAFAQFCSFSLSSTRNMELSTPLIIAGIITALVAAILYVLLLWGLARWGKFQYSHPLQPTHYKTAQWYAASNAMTMSEI
uniref:Uncharacterized protein n=1 Tax=Caenorhabditis japonica TaxID=281687 RepID=A0A8R1ICD7_CAEJA